MNETTVNGKPVTQEELENKKKDVEKKNGMSLVEVKPDTYRTKLED